MPGSSVQPLNPVPILKLPPTAPRISKLQENYPQMRFPWTCIGTRKTPTWACNAALRATRCIRRIQSPSTESTPRFSTTSKSQECNRFNLDWKQTLLIRSTMSRGSMSTTPSRAPWMKCMFAPTGAKRSLARLTPEHEGHRQQQIPMWRLTLNPSLSQHP